MEYVIKILMFLAGVVFLVYGIVIYIRNMKLLENGTIIYGKIIGFKKHGDPDGSDLISPIVEYKDSNNISKSFESSYQKGIFKRYKLNEEVSILIINEDDNIIIEIYNKFYLFYQPIGLIVPGIGIIVTMVILHLFNIA